MFAITPMITVGTVEEYRKLPPDIGYSILGVCKEPLHRQHAKLQSAAKEGYLGRAIPKDEPEYLWAERKNALYCNLIDAPTAQYIPDEIIMRCLRFIDEELANHHSILVLCNKAESRSPSIVFMWLILQGEFDEYADFESALTYFKERYYPFYNPGKGFLEYTRNFFESQKDK